MLTESQLRILNRKEIRNWEIEKVVIDNESRVYNGEVVDIRPLGHIEGYDYSIFRVQLYFPDEGLRGHEIYAYCLIKYQGSIPKGYTELSGIDNLYDWDALNPTPSSN